MVGTVLHANVGYEEDRTRSGESEIAEWVITHPDDDPVPLVPCAVVRRRRYLSAEW
jgi:hypothetical protein